MKKLMMAVMVAAGAASALAMPTKDELTKAQPLVAELMAPAMAKYKAAGYKEKAAAAAKVGDASSEFAKAAETEAAKFLLLKGAVNFYTRGEQYDKAAETVAELQREVKDVPPAVIAEITGKVTGKISEAKAPKLYALYRTAKLQVRAADEAKALAAKLKKAKSDALQRKYAEALAVSGDWKAAYAEFAKVSDAKLKEIAAAEAAGNAKSAESGEFWWAYQPAFEDAEDFFKSHAAAYYRKALDAGEITGLKKNIVEQRLEKSMSLGETGYKAPAEPDGLYCVIDLAGGPNAASYPVSYLDDVPKGGWTEEYKTTKLVLRKIEPGSFTMGDQVHGNKAFAPESCTLTKPYFIGVFEVTQRQWELVMGTRPSYFEADYITRPVEQVSYMMIRGSVNGTKWPASAAVDEESFMGVLRKKTNRNFDLPTDAQWEYACRAGTNTDFSNGKNLDSPDAASGVRHLNNSWDMVKWKHMNGIHNWKKCAKRSCDSSLCSAKVGSYAPNGNGLYDMHGNVRELCLDWDGERQSVERDPSGPLAGSQRVSRGGCWRLGLETCTSFARWGVGDSSCEAETGFRLAIQ